MVAESLRTVPREAVTVLGCSKLLATRAARIAYHPRSPSAPRPSRSGFTYSNPDWRICGHSLRREVRDRESGDREKTRSKDRDTCRAVKSLERKHYL
ncbi:hypothetical protein Bca52824_083552 [Brassica carinata]|uniref:Uncharacterized protein n=1 Tax=Brassica carinata TaxID=52824 RepID=A0A8X7TVB8_BRACI|nr:hypothetical protein Bca52824_083552 [Brassica carinata]